MERRVQPEWLDELPPDDPRAAGSRRDLARLNAWMGNASIMARALRLAFNGTPPRRLMEVGAGDGKFFLRLALLLAGEWKGTSVALLDQQSLVQEGTRRSLEGIGWSVELLNLDVFDWLSQPATEPCDALLANLFLHHFSEAQLARLFSGIAKRTPAFIAVEPRRSGWTFLLSRLVWLIGCNRVTQHDAPVSVVAGFAGKELSQLWPAEKDWSLWERPAGWFGHLFVARRRM